MEVKSGLCVRWNRENKLDFKPDAVEGQSPRKDNERAGILYTRNGKRSFQRGTKRKIAQLVVHS